jgi:MFS family permease
VPSATKQRRISPRRCGLTLALYESGLATVFTELTGGARQIGFALLLGARDLQIGLLSALPSLANLSQLTASFLLERTGQRKPLTLLSAALSRFVWMGVILLPLGLFGSFGDVRVWAMVAIVGLSALFAAMNNTFVLSLLGDLVPARLRGRYFGRRNMIIAAVGMSVPLLASLFIDAWKGWFSPQDARGFLLVFAVGIACGLAALTVHWRIPSLPLAPYRGTPFFSRLASPLRDTNFRRFILFHVCWGGSVSLASPFFAVYMLKSLHLSYTVITALTSLTALCNLIGMRFWGQLTDRFSAKPVSLLGGMGAASLPGLWLITLVAPLWIVLPLAHIFGGISWSAFNLNLNTLLLALAPRQERSIYFSVHAALTGLTTAMAPVLGGLLGKMLQEGTVPLPHGVNPYLCIFALSCLLRWSSLLLFLRVREPREVPLERLLLVFGNLRTLNTMMGFDPLFQYAYMQGERLDRFMVSRSGTLRQTLNRLDQTTDTYAAQAEAEIADMVRSGEARLKAMQARGKELEHHMNTYVTRSEAHVTRWVERLASCLSGWWQRFTRWRDRE